jgi:hypothetical protein
MGSGLTANMWYITPDTSRRSFTNRVQHEQIDKVTNSILAHRICAISHGMEEFILRYILQKEPCSSLFNIEKTVMLGMLYEGKQTAPYIITRSREIEIKKEDKRKAILGNRPYLRKPAISVYVALLTWLP